MKKTIAVLPGDGVGPEIITEAKKVLQQVAKLYKHEFIFKEGLIGAIAIDETGDPYPEATQKLCETTDAVLFGAIGEMKYDNDPSAKVRPEQGLLKMRKSLGLYANVRPIFTFESLLDKSPLKKEIVSGVDFVVIRELIGGIYFGEPRGRRDNGKTAYDTCVYTEDEILGVAKFAFDTAMARNSKKKVTVVDKANVLETSRLWRQTVQEFSKRYPEIEVEYMFVDNASMQIIKRPSEFDVMLTENMFGDILTDEASVITGSIGMLPSASMGLKRSVFEPIHGSYPLAKGMNIANPVGTILSAAMMLGTSFQMPEESQAVMKAVTAVINSGKGTKDIVAEHPLSTSEMGDAIVAALAK